MSSPTSSSAPVLPAVLGVLGGLVFLVVLTLGYFLIRNWRRDRAADRESQTVTFTEPKPRTKRVRSSFQPTSFHPENTFAPPSVTVPRFVVTASSPRPQQTSFATPKSNAHAGDKYERPTSALSNATTASFYPTSVMLSKTPDSPPLPIHTVINKTFDPNERVFK
jgi:hypothetical protein